MPAPDKKFKYILEDGKWKGFYLCENQKRTAAWRKPSFFPETQRSSFESTSKERKSGVIIIVRRYSSEDITSILSAS